VVLGDSDVVSDMFLGRTVGNTYLLRDAARWLGGEEQITGAINTEEDVPINHTRRQDLVWFYSSIFAAPALVVGLGFFMNRRRRVARKAGPRGENRPGTPAGPTPPASEVSP
jgi:hypothetical protein